MDISVIDVVTTTVFMFEKHFKNYKCIWISLILLKTENNKKNY